MLKKSLFISAFFILLAALTSLLLYSLPTASPTLSHTQLQPDGYMENVVATILNRQGRLSMKITAPKMIHYAENDTTYLTTPLFTLYRNSPLPWYIQAKYAKAYHGMENITFWENVSIHHAADAIHPATLIQTESLLVNPNQKTAFTQDFITLTQPHLVVKAVGLQADMNSGDIKLISDARGEYVPSS